MSKWFYLLIGYFIGNDKANKIKENKKEKRRENLEIMEEIFDSGYGNIWLKIIFGIIIAIFVIIAINFIKYHIK